VAVGGAFTRSGGEFAIAGVYRGARWTSGRALDPGASSSLLSVACVSAASCFAVGQYGAGARSLPLVEHWDGSRWTRLAAPAPPGTDEWLDSVSCASRSLCVAVGRNAVRDADGTEFAERWNGRAWSEVPVPGGHGVTLYSVSCAASACFAVGGADNGAGPAAYRLSGSRWRATPAASARGGWLQSVSCPLATRCLAVGDDDNGSVFADAWTGRSWAPVPVRQSGGVVRYFAQVDCVAWARCAALGSVSMSDAGWRSESAFWNGSSWKVVPTA